MMAILSSHFLNGVDGTHAANVGVTLFHLGADDVRQMLFASQSDTGGRFSHNVDAIAGDTYELVIASSAYFRGQGLPQNGMQILEDIVIRFTMPNAEAGYHIPVIMSPNSYSCWWSN